jgi:hypothetical protein
MLFRKTGITELYNRNETKRLFQKKIDYFSAFSIVLKFFKNIYPKKLIFLKGRNFVHTLFIKETRQTVNNAAPW